MANSSSPALSVASADEALFELLGIDGLSLEQDAEDENDDTPETTTKSIVQALTPPLHCNRPATPHSPLFLQTGSLISSAQCHYIIYNLGYRATNNGGETYGPQYIKAAAPDIMSTANSGTKTRVELREPNHHKVCVFTSEVVLQWIQSAFRDHVDSYISDWCRDNQSDCLDYSINPRLRLLRYDAQNEDIFLPHYDATTFDKRGWESKLTILLYLNTGDGVDFDGGNTLFLNALQPMDRVIIHPHGGSFVIFNHELFHASDALIQNDALKSEDGTLGGTKFVLRTDVLFPPTDRTMVLPTTDSIITATCAPTVTTVHEIVQSMDTAAASHLLQVLQELEMDSLPVTTFLAAPMVESMLCDFGLDTKLVQEFIFKCRAA